MANLSDAYGVIKLTGDWTTEMCKALNKIKERWESWHYSIVIGSEFSPYELELTFYGLGRWTFKSNLESLDAWTRGDLPESKTLLNNYEILVREMANRKCGIKFEYTDVESGFHVLYEGSCLFEAVDGRLTITESCETNHDYNWDNYLDCDFGGEEQLEELV